MIFIYYDYDYALMRLATDVFALANATGYSAMWHLSGFLSSTSMLLWGTMKMEVV